MSAPLSRSTLTASVLPEAAATINGVVPLGVADLGSAPAFNSAWIAFDWPCWLARYSGV